MQKNCQGSIYMFIMQQYTMSFIHIIAVFYIFHLSSSQIIPCQKGCAACISGVSTCSACPENTQLNTQGQCINSQNNNCAVYSVNTAYCIRCQPTYRSQNGTCIKDMSGCIQYQGKKCTRCWFGKILGNDTCAGTLNCKAYNKTVCTQCENGYFLSKNICYSINKNCARIDYSSGACLKCAFNFTLIGYQCLKEANSTSKNCYIWNASQCLICKDGYVLLNSTCITIPICMISYYLSPDYKCVQLPSGCRQFDSSNYTCKYCNPNYQIINNTCTTVLPSNCAAVNSAGYCVNCSQNFYSSNYSCKLVSPFCGTFNNQGKCLSCKIKQFGNLGGLCKDPYCINMTQYTCLQCTDNFQYSINHKRCILVDSNCINLTQTRCFQCYDGYYLSYDICKPLPANCLSAARSEACIECQENYYKQFDACYPVNTNISNCRVYSQTTATPVCTICELGFFVSLGKCLQVPLFCNLMLSNGNCVICINGYKLASNACTPVKKGTTDQNCANMTNNTCIRCNSNSVLGINGGCYLTVNAICQASNTNGYCSKCQNAYITSRGICLSVNIIDVNCKSYNKNECIQCYQGYYLSANQCKLPNFNCSSYNQTDGGCLTCYPGFTLTNYQCVIISKISNCLSYDSFGNCLHCSHMFFITNNTCKSVSPLCQNYNSFNGDCTSCFPGYALKDKACIQKSSSVWSNITNVTAVCKLKKGSQCLQCPYRYYLRNNICILVSSSCATYNVNGNCLTCNVGYFLKNDNCISYGTLAGTDPNCKTFQQESICLECYIGFINIQGNCQSVDPLCRTYDAKSGHCTSCYEGYTLNAGACQMQGMQTANPCLQQNTLGQCLKCIQTHYLSDHKCVYNESIKINNYNIPFCQIAANASFCSLCSDNFYPREGVCYQVSTYCQTYNPTNGSCFTCKPNLIFENGNCISPALGFDPKCKVYSGVYCSTCANGYYLKDYVCTIIDPKCINFNYDVNQCLQCSSGTPYFDVCQ